MRTLRAHARNGASLCGLDTGAFVLGFAGLLRGRRASVHYEHIDAFQERFGDVCRSRPASGTHPHRYRRRQRRRALIFHERIRGGTEGRNAALHEPLGYTINPKLRAAIVMMESNLENPLAIPAIAASINLSQRQLERLFRRHTGQSADYLDIRLDRARGLISQTDLRVVQVAVACGFASAVHFARAYRSRFGLSPRQDCVAGRVPFEFSAFPMHAAKAR